MKKLMSFLLATLMLATLLPAVMATTRVEDKDEPITGFKVYKWVSSYADNKVVVHTIEGGERGTVVIDITNDGSYEEALEVARGMLNTPPTEYSSTHGTPFAIARAWI